MYSGVIPQGTPNNMHHSTSGEVTGLSTQSEGIVTPMVYQLNTGLVIALRRTDGGTAVESVLGVMRPSTNLLRGLA